MKSPVVTGLLSALLASTGLSQISTKPASPTKPQNKKKHARKRRAPTLAIGNTVPADIALPTIDGKMRSFGELRGKVVFVHFWSIKCPWEKHAEPVILDLEAKYAGKKVAILAINANQNELGAAPSKDVGGRKKEGRKNKNGVQRAQPYAALIRHVKATKGFGHEVLVDRGNKVSRLFGARRTPHCFVIDAKGVLRYAGALDGIRLDRDNPTPFVKNAIDALLAGKDIEVKSTKPYG